MLATLRLSAQLQYEEIDIEMVKNEIKRDSLTRCINVNYEFEPSVFYVDDICIVHLYQWARGDEDNISLRFYKYENGKWNFKNEIPCFNKKMEKLSHSLFHVYSDKNMAMYRMKRYESVMRYDNFDMKPLFEYKGYDWTYHLGYLYNVRNEEFNSFLGEEVCDDYEISDIEIVSDTLKSYKLTQTKRILKGYNPDEDNDLQTIDTRTIKDVIYRK